jgi:hypothetical protein
MKGYLKKRKVDIKKGIFYIKFPYIYLYIKELYTLRFPCVSLAFCLFLAQALRSFLKCKKMAQGGSYLADKTQGIKHLIINILRVIKYPPCALAPKKYPSI